MRYAPLILIFVALSISPAITYAQRGWKLVWSDEFNYEGLPDTTKWAYDIGGSGWGNNERQFYTRRKQNCRVEEGKLIIEARKESVNGMNYTSARLVTRGKANWTYGRIEVRAMLPKGRGTWPAIWLLPANHPLKWPDDGEIDIMEHVGYDQGNVHATIHCKKYNAIQNTHKGAILMVPDCSTAFHNYSVEWTKDGINSYIDGKRYFYFANEHSGREAWPFDDPMYLVMNLAIGGSWGGLKGIDDSIFPQRMEVDYVKVYQK